MDTIAELAVEPVRIQQRQEELEVLLLAVVRRGRHQQQMPGLGAQPFSKLEAPGLFQFCPVKVRRELVRFVKDHQIPCGRTQLVLQFRVARHLVEPDDQVIVVLERIAAGRSQLQLPREDAKLQAELLKQLIPPLLHQAARRHHQHPPRVRAHKQLADIQPGHDRLARARIIGQHIAQRLARQHGFVNGRDLVRQRVHVRRMDRHHGIEQEGQVDTLRLDRQLEILAATIESPRPLQGRHRDRRLIRPAQQALLQRPIRRFVDDRHRAISDRHHRHHRSHRRRLQPGQRHPRRKFLKPHTHSVEIARFQTN